MLWRSDSSALFCVVFCVVSSFFCGVEIPAKKGSVVRYFPALLVISSVIEPTLI